MSATNLDQIKKAFALKGFFSTYNKNDMTFKVVISDSAKEDAICSAMAEVESEIKLFLKSRKIALKTLSKNRSGKVVVTSEEMNPYELVVLIKNTPLGKIAVPTEAGLVLDAKRFGKSTEERAKELLEQGRSEFKNALSSLMRKKLIPINTPMRKESDMREGSEVIFFSL